MNKETYKEIAEYSEQEVKQCLYELFSVLNSKYQNIGRETIHEIVSDIVYDIIDNADYYTSLPVVSE